MNDQTATPMKTAPDPFDARTFRHTLGQFATGVIVITTESDGQTHGMTANAFMSGSMSPPLIIVSVDKRAHMHALLQAGNRFSISILASDQEALSRHFSGQSQNIDIHFTRLDDQPVIEGALAWISTRTEHRYDCGDHTLFVGHVTALHHHHGRKALGFHQGAYAGIIPLETVTTPV